MKYSTYCALIGVASATKLTAKPDVYGKNGENYSNVDPSEIMAKIGIDISEAGTGENCKETDWATVHYKGTLTNGLVVTDSKSEGDGLPKTFTVGRHEVFKCWDLALTQLKTGSKATVHCPAESVWGGFEAVAPLGGDPVPKGSDVSFELEVVHCNVIPYEAPVNAQPHTTTMQPGKCFYLHSDKSEGSEVDLVLATEPYSGQDWRNVIVEPFVRDEKEQQWFYDADKNSIHNAAFPDLWLENWYGFLGTYTWYDGHHQYWDYDGTKSEFFNGESLTTSVSCGGHTATTCSECPNGNGAAWCNGDCKWQSSDSQCVYKDPSQAPSLGTDVTDKAFALTADNDNNVRTTPTDDNNKNQKWHIEYCYKNF